jgi:hypothetical protein
MKGASNVTQTSQRAAEETCNDPQGETGNEARKETTAIGTTAGYATCQGVAQTHGRNAEMRSSPDFVFQDIQRGIAMFATRGVFAWCSQQGNQ